MVEVKESGRSKLKQENIVLLMANHVNSCKYTIFFKVSISEEMHFRGSQQGCLKGGMSAVHSSFESFWGMLLLLEEEQLLI